MIWFGLSTIEQRCISASPRNNGYNRVQQKEDSDFFRMIRINPPLETAFH